MKELERIAVLCEKIYGAAGDFAKKTSAYAEDFNSLSENAKKTAINAAELRQKESHTPKKMTKVGGC